MGVEARPGQSSAPNGGPALQGEFNYTAPEVLPYPGPIRWARDRLFRLFLCFAFGGTALGLLIAYFTMDRGAWAQLAKYCSIPLVSIMFTWWHVWLGIKMCFYPVEFVGCCKPFLGWQGIVPRRAHIMASRSCDIMIGTLITVEEIINRIEPEDFFDNLKPVLAAASGSVLEKVVTKRWPEVWAMLPDSVRNELIRKVIEESQRMFHPVIEDLKSNINQIVDIKQMAIDVLVDNKPLLVEMFQEIGRREFVFIQHMAAVMGFVLGIIQMLLWIALNSGGDEAECKAIGSHPFRCYAGFVVLPVSGLIIGYFTNWLGITMIFRPVEPHIICGGYVNIQGVFLKRQQEVSKELATKICDNLVHAKKMMEYVVKRTDTLDKVLLIYEKHMLEAIDTVMGRAKAIVPVFVGDGAMQGIKQEVLAETLAELPKHSRRIEAYMDRAFDLKETLAYRLAHLHPRRFEGMLHPVFQEDEWMVLLLGGVLGVMVGTFQAFALGS